MCEIRVAEPDEDRDVIRPKVMRFLERHNRLCERPLRLVEMPEIIRPPHVGWREPPCVEVARLGGIEVGRGHQEFAQLAVSGAEIGVGDVPMLDLPDERGVSSA